MTFPDTPLVLTLLFTGLLSWLAGLLLLLLVGARALVWLGRWSAGLWRSERQRQPGRHRYRPSTARVGTAEQDQVAIAAHDAGDGAQ
ncbi:hypothetical protein [Streptomyces sp. NPDC053048]|uniref:hypothetical protein n=1 Tax=Streptomyces sp. NPDC053048 TaxID=3365694 RepID=UPI0037D5E977